MNAHVDPKAVQESNFRMVFKPAPRVVPPPGGSISEEQEREQMLDMQMNISKAVWAMHANRPIVEQPAAVPPPDPSGEPPVLEEQPLFIWDGPDTVLLGYERPQ